MNKKGITLVEMIVSIALISIVLVLLMNLFVNIRSVYNRSKIEADYKVTTSTIINAVSKDIEKYGLASVVYTNSDAKDSLTFTFKSYRPTILSEQIVKILKVYSTIKDDRERFFISYAYDTSLSKNLTSSERIESEVRILPEDAYLNESNYINLETKSIAGVGKLVKVKIPISNNNGNVYDIIIVGNIK